VTGVNISTVAGSDELARTTARLLDQLPAWFGRPEANAAYVRSASELPAVVARTGEQTIGGLLYRRHFPQAAEIHLMAISPEWHRQGIGKAMIHRLVSDLRLDGCQVLQVKTLGASHPDKHYAITRAFYLSVGFLPLEEIATIWPGSPCLVMVMPLA
jgi:GNAT superfamily N-acetyltransferase